MVLYRDEDWNWLLHMTQCVAYHRDDVIIEEGSKQRRLIQIGSGHVRIVKKVVVSSGYFLFYFLFYFFYFYFLTFLYLFFFFLFSF